MFNQNKKYELTWAQLKQCKDFENITEDEAKLIASQLKAFSLILFEIFQTNQKKMAIRQDKAIQSQNKPSKNNEL